MRVKLELTFVVLRSCVWFAARRVLTEWQDFDARKLAHTILEYLIRFGQSDVLEADVVDRQDLIAHVNGSTSTHKSL